MSDKKKPISEEELGKAQGGTELPLAEGREGDSKKDKSEGSSPRRRAGFGGGGVSPGEGAGNPG